MPLFLPGLDLARRFYQEAVQPILASGFPALRYSAALIGSGSEVLGFDTEMSTDHDWGPRLLLFLDEADYHLAPAIHTTLRHQLPSHFLGYATSSAAAVPPEPEARPDTAHADRTDHRVELWTLRRFGEAYLGFDLTRSPAAADWLTFPEQKLRALTAGAVFYDAVGLVQARERVQYYPRDVWLYLLAAAWNRIGQEEHLMGRAGMVGDELGSSLIAARLVRDLMRLWFLMARQYAPYPKWFGTAFAQLPGAADVTPALHQALRAATWREREQALAPAYESAAARHNALQITAPMPATVTPFFDRPFKVIAIHGFAEAIRAQITDPAVRQIAQRRLIGGIDLVSDNTDLLTDAAWQPLVRALYT